jgi:hypothetical protein
VLFTPWGWGNRWLSGQVDGKEASTTCFSAMILILSFLNNEKHIAHLTTHDVELGAMAKEQWLLWILESCDTKAFRPFINSSTHLQSSCIVN